MSGVWRLARSAVVTALAAGVMFGCGQQGPLVLPESARPIERLEQPPAATPEDEADDERENER
jgi:predicted small lipoprotein YifL